MTRKKVKLAWIENDNTRAIILRKRRAGLLKKVKELSILCDVNACMIIFSPNEAVPVVWPSVETARDLLDDFFALPRYEHIKKEMDVELYLNEKTNKVNEKMIKSCQKNKEYVTNELMMQLQCGRTINDLNLTEIYTLLSFSRDTIIYLRKKLDFMQFSPLRDLTVLPFEAQVEQFKITTNDAFLGGDQDDERAGNTNEATKMNNINSLRKNKSYYLIDQWFPTSEPPKPVIYEQIGYENPNRRGYYPYHESSSNGNPNLETMSVYPQVMTFQDLVGSASQVLQHQNMDNNPIMTMNQPIQYPFDFMCHEMGIQGEEGNINNLQFCRTNNTTTTNDGLRQEVHPNKTITRESNTDAASFDINGNPNLEMMSVCPQVMTFRDLVGSASQPLQHQNMNNNPIVGMNQPRQYPFDFMSHELEIQRERGNINNSQFCRTNNTTTTNVGLPQEAHPKETTAGESFTDATSFNINGNRNLEMMSVFSKVMTFHGSVGSASQPLQHQIMNNNPIVAMNQPKQYPFDFMSDELGIQGEGGNINNSQFYRINNTTTTYDGLCQEAHPNETTAGESNIDATSFHVNRIWPDFNNHRF